MTERPDAMKNRCVAWEKKIETNVQGLAKCWYSRYFSSAHILKLIKGKKMTTYSSASILPNPMLSAALSHPLWNEHKIGDTYTMDGKPDLWKIAYYPIFEDGKTNQPYSESRALIEKPMIGGTDFREVPLRYLTKKP